ncbi:macrophage migration inhibitory factor-like [Glandiceps talaboti]
MPTLQIFTSLSKDKIPDDLYVNCCKIIAELLDKPEKNIMIHVDVDQHMSYAGTCDPCAFMVLSSIGRLGRDKNKECSERIMRYITDALGIPGDRMYLQFRNMDAENVGYNYTTKAFM